MKESERFDNILDECLERLLGGETVEQCLQSYPEQAAELEPLLQTAQVAKKASTIQPRAEFRDRARYQFHSAFREMESKRGLRLFAWQSRWATAVVVILILVLVGGGTVVAAGNSMPDGALYPVKLATEQARLTLTPSVLSKAELYTRLADKRVAEIAYMASKGDPQRVELVAQRLDTYLAKIATLAAAPGEEARVMLAPTPVPEVAREAPRDVSPQANKRAKIRVIMMRYAMNHPDRLRAALKAAPESVKPALRRAIQASEAGYEKALKSIGGGEEQALPARGKQAPSPPGK